MKKRFFDLAVAAVVLGVVQSVAETLLLSWLYRDLLLTPYRFFPSHIYDAFTKLWFAAGEHLRLPLLLQGFVGQGVAAKLPMAAALVSVNLSVGVVLAVMLTPLAGLFGIGRERGAVRALALLTLVSLVVHGAVWFASFQAPQAATAFKLLRSVVRDALQGGVAPAVGVLVVSSLLARALLETRAAAGASLVAGLLLVACAHATGTAEATPRDTAVAVTPSPVAGYNIVLLSIDSLRADHLGVYGYARDTSPTIDALAKGGGVQFRHHESSTSWTLPAHMSLLTSRSLLGHGVVSDDRSLSKRVATLAESFQSGGYETHAIVSAPYLNSRYGFARGFDDYDDHTIFFETNEDSYRSVTAPKVVDAAGAWLGQKHDKPFFLFLHFWDVHYDYAPGAPYDRMFDPDYKGTVEGNNFYFDPEIRDGMNPRDLAHLVALYDGEIRLVDDHLARLRAELSRLGLAGRTILAVTADHGDEFFEHGNKGHHRTLYEEVLHTPFIVNVPGLAPSASSVNIESSIVDVGPTLTGLAGVAPPEGAEGRDFSGLWTGAHLPPSTPVHAELYRTGTRNVQAAEIGGGRKVIHHFQKRWLESYDLEADPGEQKSLPAADPLAAPIVSSLRDWIDGRWQRFDKRLRTEGIDPVILDAKAKEQLRSLGYLQ